MIGIAPSADLISVRNGDSRSAGFSTAALQWQLDHAEEFAIKVSSNSWGCPGGCPFNPNSATALVVKDLYLAGVVTTFAVGNDGGGPSGSELSGHAQNPFALGVAAYDDSNSRLASFSSRDCSEAPLSTTRRHDPGAARLTGGGTPSGRPAFDGTDDELYASSSKRHPS